MFYETGTDHGLPYDPFKVSGSIHIALNSAIALPYSSACNNARML